MKVVYTLTKRPDLHRELRIAVSGIRECLAEVTRVRMEGGGLARIIGYLRAWPYEMIVENQPDGRVKVEYDFWLVDPMDSNLFIEVLKLKKARGDIHIKGSNRKDGGETGDTM